MKKQITTLLWAMLFVTVPVAFGQEPVESSAPRMEAVRARFEAAAREACADRGVELCGMLSFSSMPLIDDMNYYYAVIQVGPGEFDRIGIGRIIREHHPGKAIDGNSAVFFIHGSAQTFFDSCVNASTISTNPGIAPWLAERGIDVWGIDMRFALVPSTTAEFSFMAGWNFGNMTNDVLLATRLARHTRRMTGQHFGKLHLAGRSLGASFVYSVANAEAVLPEGDQDIGDIIPIETVYKLPPSDTAAKAYTCNVETSHRTAMNNGIYHIDGRAAMAIGEAGRSNPDAPSSVTGLTNKQLALRTECVNSMLPAFPYHMAACGLDSNNIPSAGRFSPTVLVLDALANGIPFRTRGIMADYFGIPCGNNDLPYDDHLAEVRIPSLYVGAAGGFGSSGTFTNSLLGSSDKATIFIQMLTPQEAKSDFGHIEAFIGNEAASLVWVPVLQWVLDHDPSPKRR
jgi:hypothetical protein